MAKQEKLYSATEGAYMTRLTLFSFRTKVSQLGIKGQRQGRRVFYSRRQLEDVYAGVSNKRAGMIRKTSKAKSAIHAAARRRKRD